MYPHLTFAQRKPVPAVPSRVQERQTYHLRSDHGCWSAQISSFMEQSLMPSPRDTAPKCRQNQGAAEEVST